MEYDITSRKNPHIMHLRRLGTDKDYRHERKEYLGCGEKLLKEALLHHAEILRLYRVPGEAEGLCPEGTEEYLVPGDVLDSASPFKSSTGVLFTCRMPEEAELPGDGGYVVLENVQDPGNVGTVLRSANAFGIPLVALLGDCADLFNPKAVRASMGAVFRQKTARITLETLEREKARGLRILGAALGEGCTDIRKTDLNGAVVAIGSEGRGLTDELLSRCTGRIQIPMMPACESLNAAAAAAVILWEMGREKL